MALEVDSHMCKKEMNRALCEYDHVFDLMLALIFWGLTLEATIYLFLVIKTTHWQS